MNSLSTLLCCLLFGPAFPFKAPTSKRIIAQQYAVHVPDTFAPFPIKPAFSPFEELVDRKISEHTKTLHPFDEAMDDSASTISPSTLVADATALTAPPSVVAPKKKGPTLQTWARRLATKEDRLSLHKISNAGFVVSSTTILAGMMFPNEQGLVAIPMILKHRNKDPELGKTQIGMGLTSILMAVFSTWEGPVCPTFLEDHWKPIFGALILTVCAYDFLAAFGNYAAIQTQMAKIGVNTEANSFQDEVRSFFSFRALFVAGSLANLVFLVNFLDPARDRADWLEYIQVGYNLPFCSGADMPLIYFSTVLAATIISYQSLLATLANKKLVSPNLATSLIGISTGVVACSLLQLLFARSLYS